MRDFSSHFFWNNKFPEIRVEAYAKDFMKVLNSLVEGDGRDYDILDEEIYGN